MSGSKKNIKQADMADAVESSSSMNRSATRQPSNNSDDELDSLATSNTENGATHQNSSGHIIAKDNGQSLFATIGDVFPGQPSTSIFVAGEAPISTSNVNSRLQSNGLSSKIQMPGFSSGTFQQTKESAKFLCNMPVDSPLSISTGEYFNTLSISSDGTIRPTRRPTSLGSSVQPQNRQFPKFLQPPTIFTNDGYSPGSFETKSVESESSWNSFHSKNFLLPRGSSDTSSGTRDGLHRFTGPFRSSTDSGSNYKSQYECESRPRYSNESRISSGHYLNASGNVAWQTGYLPRTPYSHASNGGRTESFQAHNNFSYASNDVSRNGESQRTFSSASSASRNVHLPIARYATLYTGSQLIPSLPIGPVGSAQSFQGYVQSPYNAASPIRLPQTRFYSMESNRSATSSDEGRSHSPKVRYNDASFIDFPHGQFDSKPMSRSRHTLGESNNDKSKCGLSPEVSDFLERRDYYDRNPREPRLNLLNPETSSKASEGNVFSSRNQPQEHKDSKETDASYSRSGIASQVGHQPTATGGNIILLGDPQLDKDFVQKTVAEIVKELSLNQRDLDL